MSDLGEVLGDDRTSPASLTPRGGGVRGARERLANLARPFAGMEAAPVAMLCLALPSLALKALIGIDTYDEGIRLYGAMRVLHGSVPYHDFFASYGPAQFYWPAAWFAILGEQLWVARLSELAGMGGAVVALTLLLRQASAGWSVILWTASAMLLPLAVIPINGFDPSLALVLAAGAAAGSRPSLRSLSLAGLLLGAASLFRHDFGFYGAVATTAMLVVSALTERASARRPLAALGRTLVVAAAACVVALPVYGWLARPDPYALWDLLIRKPPELIAFRHLPYAYALKELVSGAVLKPSPHDALRSWILLNPIVALVGLAALAHRGVRAELFAEPRRRAVLLFLATLSAGLLVYAGARTDIYHLYPMQAIVSAQLAMVASAWVRATVRPRYAVALRRLSSVLVTTILTVGLVDRIVSFAVREPVPLERALHIRARGGEKWLVQAVDDIRRSAGDAPVYIGSGRHDRVFTNFLAAYFLLGRAAPTYYHDILPGLTTTAPVQRRMVDEIEVSGTQSAFLWKQAPVTEPNLSATEQGSTLLDEYLARHFRVTVERPQYLVLVRRP